MEKGDENEETTEYIKTDVVWIPSSPTRPEVLKVEDFVGIQMNEILAISAIYGSITIHNDRSGLIGGFLSDQGELIVFSKEVESNFNNKDGIEVRVLFIPGEDETFDEEEKKSRYIVDSSYELSGFTVYSLVLSRSVSEAMPFKNRRYWRITHLYARITVYYGDKYPITNPALLFEFSLELPKSINVKLVEEIQEILVNRSGDQECIFQVINCLEMIMDDLCDYLQVSEDLWEQMRRQNNQREFERHLDNSVLSGDHESYLMEADDANISGVSHLGRRNMDGEAISNNGLDSAKDFEMVTGFLDDTILDYPTNTTKMSEYNYVSNPIVSLDWFYIQNESFEHNINYSLISSKRFTQDFRVLDVIYSGKNVMITKSLHLIDQNNYQVSIYRVSSEKFDKIQARVSSLVMLQQRYMARYYQCWVEKCDNKNDERNDEESFVLLYIQSEFMGENMTLLDFFEKGKVKNRDDHVIWSLFRQILEILSYCHRNEVFHLNLSSNCIYIEEDIYGYSVKLSSFIFGAHMSSDFDSNDKEFSLPSVLFTEETRLADEILKIDTEYTASIFLEMWLRIKYKGSEYEKFQARFLEWFGRLEVTNEDVLVGEINQLALEVSKSVDELFSFNAEIPTEFKYIPKTALLVIRKLRSQESFALNTNIDDLLKSDLLPSSINKNEFQYYLSRICNPRTYESHITLNTLFGRSIDMISSTGFLVDIQSDEQVNIIDLTFSDIVKTSITKVLDDHNFVLWKLPILYPTQFLTDKGINSRQSNNKEFQNLLYKCGYRTRDPHFLLDISNNLLCLPKSAPFSMICSLVSLLVGDHFNKSSGFGVNFAESEGKTRKSVGTGTGANIEGIYCASNMMNGSKTDDFQPSGGMFPGICGVTLESYYKHLNMYIHENSPIQRYALFPIYEKSRSNIAEGGGDGDDVFGHPRAKLSLAFDMIYQFNEPSDSSVVGGNSGVLGVVNCHDFSGLNSSMLPAQGPVDSNYPIYDDLKRIYQLNECGEIQCLDNIMLEVEGLLLTLKLVLPWLDYLEDVPFVRLTFPLMTRIVYLELLEKMLSSELEEEEMAKMRGLNIFTQKSAFNQVFSKRGEEEDVCDEIDKRVTFIRELFLEMYPFEWKYDSNFGNYRLKSVYENKFILRVYEYVRDNHIIKLYVQVLNEILNLLSESTDLLIYNDKKVKFYFDPVMDYDMNLYDQTSLVYSITSEKMIGKGLIYGMGGSYSQKINGILSNLYANTLNITGLSHSVNNSSVSLNYTFAEGGSPPCAGVNNIAGTNAGTVMGLGTGSFRFQNLFNCIMGEVSIELLIEQVCEMAKRYRSEFVNTGGYIKGISVNDVSNVCGGVLFNNTMGESAKTSLGGGRRGSWGFYNTNYSNSSGNGRSKVKNNSVSGSRFEYSSQGDNRDLRGDEGVLLSPTMGVYEFDGVTDLSRELLLKPISLLKSCYPRVIVMTQTAKLQSKVLSLTRKLWQRGVRSEYRLTPVRSLSIFLEKLKRSTLVELLIVVMFQNNNAGFLGGNSFYPLSGTGSGVGAGIVTGVGSGTEVEAETEANISTFSFLMEENKNQTISISQNTSTQEIQVGGDHYAGGMMNMATSSLPIARGGLAGAGLTGSNISFENTKNKNVMFRIEPISGMYYETSGFQSIKVIVESEESVVSYVTTKRRRQIIN